MRARVGQTWTPIPFGHAVERGPMPSDTPSRRAAMADGIMAASERGTVSPVGMARVCHAVVDTRQLSNLSLSIRMG